MWEDYGKDGYGVELTISMDTLLQITQAQDVRINPCLYCTFEEYTEKYMRSIATLYNIIDGATYAFFVRQIEICNWAKDSQYSKENEYRLIKCVDPDIAHIVKTDDNGKKYVEVMIPLNAFVNIRLGYKILFTKVLNEIYRILHEKMDETLCFEFLNKIL